MVRFGKSSIFLLLILLITQLSLVGCGSNTETTDLAAMGTARVSFNSASQSIAEDVGQITVTLMLDVAQEGNAQINIAVSGTAQGNGVDHSLSTSQTVQIDEGQTSADLTIDIIDENLLEDAETIILTIDSVNSAQLGSITEQVITIEENDSVLTLYPKKDNTLIAFNPGETSNGAGPILFVGRTGQAEAESYRRGLIYFDLAGEVPAGEQIDGAKLILTPMGGGASAGDEVWIHTLEADWGEGTSIADGGRGAPATLGDATWMHTFYDTSFWSNPGGDYNPSFSATGSLNTDGDFEFNSTDMATDVQGWFSTPSTNFGWILLGDETEERTVITFAAREDAENAPRLILSVSIP